MQPDDDKRLLQAIDCVIRDVDKKYDECLVDHFMEYVYSANRTRNISEITTDNSTLLSILNRLKSYFDHKAFIMMNQARAYKTFHAIIKGRPLDSQIEFDKLTPYLESFWATVDSIIINENLSAVTILLSILQELSKSRYGFTWICKAVFEPELKLRKGGRFYHIHKILGFIEFYLTDCNNYHTKNKAEFLLKSLIERDIIDNCDINECRLFREETGILMKDLIAKNSLSILIIISKVLEDNSNDAVFLESFNCHYKPTEIVYNSLMETLANSKTNPNELCKCLASINSRFKDKEPNNVFKLLIDNHKIEAAIIYLSHLREDNSKMLKDQQLYYLLSCISQRASESVRSKIEEFYNSMSIRAVTTIVINPEMVTDKLVTTSIMSFHRILNLLDVNNDELFLIKDVMIDYINNQYKLSKSFKNVMECCNIIKLCSSLLGTSVEQNNTSYLDSITKSIANLDLTADRSKLTVINLLGSLKFRHKNYSQIERLFDTICKLTDDHDVVNEFVEMFISSGVDFREPDMEQEAMIERCVEVFWNGIHKNVQETEHLDLIGNLYIVLAKINQQVDGELLKKFGIYQGQTIPNLINNYRPPHENESELDTFASEGNKMVNSTIVNDIINYELISDGIIDCY